MPDGLFLLGQSAAKFTFFRRRLSDCDVRWMEEDIIEYASDGSQYVQECYQKEKKIRACSDIVVNCIFLFFLRTQRTTGPMQCLPVLASVVSSHQPNNDVISECQDKIVCTLNMVYCESRCHVHY